MSVQDIQRSGSGIAGTSPQKLSSFLFITFLLIGTTQLAGWNFLLNSLQDVVENIKGVPHSDYYGVTVTATFSTVIVLLTVFFTFVSGVYTWVLYSGIILTFLSTLVYALTSHFASASISKGLLHAIGGTMALASALIANSAFGFAARFPENYTGAASAGLGLSGVVTFVVYLATSITLGARMEDNEGYKISVWITAAVVSVFYALSGLFFWKATDKIVSVSQDDTADEEAEGTLESGTYETSGVWGIVQIVWVPALTYFFHMFISLFCFPTIGPVSWNMASTSSQITIGIFQVADLIGRYAPNYLPFLMVKLRTACVLVLLRSVFIATFILSAYFQTTAVLGTTWFQMLQMTLLALTNGWLCTVFFMRMPQDVTGNQAKSRVASICLLATYVGIAAGQWVAVPAMPSHQPAPVVPEI